MTRPFAPAIGSVFGRLTVTATALPLKQKSRAEVTCACGQVLVVRVGSLLSGNTTSCGCAPRICTHGHAGKKHGANRTYRIWSNMRARAAGQISASNYADRGISVCDRWLSFENFLADMGEAPEGLSLERKNNDGDYEPSNCKWATQAEQSRNRRTNVFVEINGRKQCVADWAKEFGLLANTFRRRFESGQLDTNNQFEKAKK